MDNICYSGGSQGADTIFGECAKKAGHKVVHFSFPGHYAYEQALREGADSNFVVLSSEQLQEADSHLKAANFYLKRCYPTRYAYMNNLLRRNYYQIKDTDCVYAVSTIDEKGRVQGGTGWAVTMAIHRIIETRNNPADILVFDQVKESWFGFTTTIGNEIEWCELKPGSVKMLGGKYTGIGSRALLSSGEQAIRELYQ